MRQLPGFTEHIACLDKIMTKGVEVDDRHFPGMSGNRFFDIVENILHHDAGERIEEIEIIIFIQRGERGGVTTLDPDVCNAELPHILSRNLCIFWRYFYPGDLRERVLRQRDEHPALAAAEIDDRIVRRDRET